MIRSTFKINISYIREEINALKQKFSENLKLADRELLNLFKSASFLSDVGNSSICLKLSSPDNRDCDKSFHHHRDDNKSRQLINCGQGNMSSRFDSFLTSAGSWSSFNTRLGDRRSSILRSIY
jgi:hypothetical protein